MRLLIASLMAVTAVAFAAPSFAQEESTPAPTTSPAPTPAAKPSKHKTASNSCSALKSQSAKSACLKRTHTAHAAPTKTPHKGTKKVASKQSAPTPMAPASDPAGSAPASAGPGPVSVPPLPQKTI